MERITFTAKPECLEVSFETGFDQGDTARTQIHTVRTSGNDSLQDIVGRLASHLTEWEWDAFKSHINGIADVWEGE